MFDQYKNADEIYWTSIFGNNLNNMFSYKGPFIGFLAHDTCEENKKRK